MKNIYSVLKLSQSIRSVRLKLFGVFLLHCFKRRYFALYVDPVLACNLRCRMCYFSDEEKRKQMKGIFNEEDMEKLANAFFHRALKLQIGCGAEPSLFRHNKRLIELAKKKGIPYISMTTNGNLFSESDWLELANAGLDEVTLSLHGTRRDTYEYFMAGADFDRFLSAMETLTKIKEIHPAFKVRLNYTVNNDNLAELKDFFRVFAGYKIDVLQIRPIQPLGNTVYSDFSWEAIYASYDSIMENLKNECQKRKIIGIIPDKQDMVKETNSDSRLVDAAYFYVSPRCCWSEDFDLSVDTYESYSRRTCRGWKLLKDVFCNSPKSDNDKRHLNYKVN
ncbi:MAG: radical SAM protein [Dysgonamonadaceae bacterium]|jgi:molybdenum cofactor biosynthesis enzyme MoaA|nr:radical SAM protein [Dysgonamonadaceae bacterium]